MEAINGAKDKKSTLGTVGKIGRNRPQEEEVGHEDSGHEKTQNIGERKSVKQWTTDNHRMNKSSDRKAIRHDLQELDSGSEYKTERPGRDYKPALSVL